MPKTKSTTHNMSHTRTYNAWRTMIQRCTNPRNPVFRLYGARGITVDSRWLIFSNFYEDMGEAPDRLTLERRDNDKGYSKNNCYWATQKEQSRNTRRNHLIEFRGETLCVSAWAEKLGIEPNTLQGRLKKWPLERALTEGKIVPQRLFSLNGMSKTLTGWSSFYGIPYSSLYYRIIHQSMSLPDAIEKSLATK